MGPSGPFHIVLLFYFLFFWGTWALKTGLGPSLFNSFFGTWALFHLSWALQPTLDFFLIPSCLGYFIWVPPLVLGLGQLPLWHWAWAGPAYVLGLK